MATAMAVNADKEFQTCSHINGTNIYKTFIEAFNAYKEDKSIWKISFDDADGTSMRWRPKTKSILDIWENEDCLLNLSATYSAEQDTNRVFWVWQLAIDVEYFCELIAKRNRGEITHNECSRLNDRANIKCVLTEEEFVNRFKML